jgi:hypothetical protein
MKLHPYSRRSGGRTDAKAPSNQEDQHRDKGIAPGKPGNLEAGDKDSRGQLSMFAALEACEKARKHRGSGISR